MKFWWDNVSIVLLFFPSQVRKLNLHKLMELAVGWFKMQESQKFYPGTSFSEEIYLVMQENAKKVEKNYHLGVANQLWSLCTVRQ